MRLMKTPRRRRPDLARSCPLREVNVDGFGFGSSDEETNDEDEDGGYVDVHVN